MDMLGSATCTPVLESDVTEKNIGQKKAKFAMVMFLTVVSTRV